MSLPGASELFRATRPATDDDTAADAVAPDPVAPADDAHEGTAEVPTPEPGEAHAPSRRRRPSGRVRHDEKITVYVSTEELLALEQARFVLRAEHGTAVDRGRIVREAVSLALEELAAQGADSTLARRLSTS